MGQLPGAQPHGLDLCQRLTVHGDTSLDSDKLDLNPTRRVPELPEMEILTRMLDQAHCREFSASPNFSNLTLGCFLLSVGTLSSSRLAHVRVKSRFQVGPCESPIIFSSTNQQGRHIVYQSQQPGRSGARRAEVTGR